MKILLIIIVIVIIIIGIFLVRYMNNKNDIKTGNYYGGKYKKNKK